MEEEIVRMEINASEEDAEVVRGLLWPHIAYGWEEVEEPGGLCFVVHMEQPWLGEELEQKVTSVLPEAGVSTFLVPKRDWTSAWREFFTAVPCGEDFIVIAPWMTNERPFPQRIPIIIEPKMAFGTGHHATTALCLECISSLHRSGRLDAQTRYLDLGTGSGILGIGCAKLGASGVGIDNDPVAIENAEENIRINGVADKMRLVLGSIDTAGEAVFDLVVANILAEPLIQLAPEIQARIAPGGVLVLSGILAIQADQVAAAYEALGMPAPEIRVSGEWAALYWL